MSTVLDVEATQPAEEPPPPPAERRAPAWVRALFCSAVPAVVTAFVVAYQAGVPGLWRDELASWTAATRTVPQILDLGRHIDGVIVPYYLFLHAWIGWFGDSAAAMRMPSVIAMALAAGVVALLARRFWGETAGLLAGLLFGTMPVVSRYGQEIRGYAPAVLFAVLATLLLLAALDRSRWWTWCLYGLCVALLGMSHLVAVLLLAGHLVIVAAAVGPGDRRRALWWALACAGGVGAVLPLTARGFGQQALQLAWLPEAQPAALADLPGSLFEVAVLGGAVPALAVCALRLDRAFQAGLLWACALLPVGLLFTYDQVGAPIFVSRYLLFCVPLLCALAGAALAALRLPLALAVVLVLGAVGLPTQERDREMRSKYDYAAAAEVIRRNQQAGDAVVYAPRAGWQLVDVGLKYYLRDRAPRDVLMAADQVASGSLWATECADAVRCLGDAGRVWVVAADNSAPPFRATATNQLTYGAKAALRPYADLAVWRVEGFTVTLMVRPPRV